MHSITVVPGCHAGKTPFDVVFYDGMCDASRSRVEARFLDHDLERLQPGIPAVDIFSQKRWVWVPVLVSEGRSSGSSSSSWSTMLWCLSRWKCLGCCRRSSRHSRRLCRCLLRYSHRWRWCLRYPWYGHCEDRGLTLEERRSLLGSVSSIRIWRHRRVPLPASAHDG